MFAWFLSIIGDVLGPGNNEESARVFENSVRSSAGFDLVPDSYYNIDHELLLESESQNAHLPRKASLRHFVGLVMFADFCFLIATFSSSHSPSNVFFKIPVPANASLSLRSFLMTVILAILSLCALYSIKLYRLETIGSFKVFCSRFFVTLAVLLATCIAYQNILTAQNAMHSTVLLDDLFSRYFFAWSCLTIGLFLALHYASTEIFHFLVARGHVSHDVVVIGTAGVAESFIAKVRADKLGVAVRAVFDEILLPGLPQSVGDVAVKGDVSALLQYAKHHPIDMVVIASENPTVDALASLIKKVTVQPLRIGIVTSQLATLKGINALPIKQHIQTGALPGVSLIVLQDVPISGLASVVKAGIDIIVAIFALLLFAPLMLICGVGIKLVSPGPILFKQNRIGYRNKDFQIYKFRTMHLAACNTGELTTRNDPRVFKFGEIMRKFSLDELPQLFNVLKGDMSLVGPRPHIHQAKAAGIPYFEAVANYAARHRVKPGITGWAQVNGWRGPTETIEQIENRVLNDLYYIENWNLALDFIILAKTVFGGFFGKNAF